MPLWGITYETIFVEADTEDEALEKGKEECPEILFADKVED